MIPVRWMLPIACLLSACSDDVGTDSGGAGAAGTTSGGASSTGGGPSTSTTSAGGSGGGTTASTSTTGGGGQGGTGGASNLMPPPCPPGTTELAADLQCTNAGTSISTDFEDAVGSSIRGEIVAGLEGLGSATCLPTRTCVPESAPTLIFSDEPEYVATDGVLYADELETGRYRVYVYHVNDGASPRRFTVVALNQMAVPATITVEKLATTAPSTDYLGVGRAVAESYLTATGKPAIMVPGMTRVVVDTDVDALVADPDELIHTMFQLQVIGDVKLSIVSVPANADAAAVTAGLSLLPNTNTHVRGTFPMADRLILTRHPGGLTRLRLGGDESIDPHIMGTNYVDGGAATLAGNFGVLYDLRVIGPAESLFLGVNPRAGTWAGGALGSAGLDASGGSYLLPSSDPTVSSNQDVVAMGRYTSGIDIGATLLTAGGSNLPVHVVMAPLP